MGTKYMAYCQSYPSTGLTEFSIQSKWLLPFMFKLVIASFKYPIIRVEFRDFKKMRKKEGR